MTSVMASVGTVTMKAAVRGALQVPEPLRVRSLKSTLFVITRDAPQADAAFEMPPPDTRGSLPLLMAYTVKPAPAEAVTVVPLVTNPPAGVSAGGAGNAEATQLT